MLAVFKLMESSYLSCRNYEEVLHVLLSPINVISSLILINVSGKISRVLLGVKGWRNCKVLFKYLLSRKFLDGLIKLVQILPTSQLSC